MSHIAHAEHPIRSPLDDGSVRRLLERGLTQDDERVLDLGCGGGEWLLRALTTRPDAHSEGVDIPETALAHSAGAALDLGVRDRLVLHHRKGEEFVSEQPFDVVLSSGAAHAFGGFLPTLAAARARLAPGAVSSSVTVSGKGPRRRRPSRCSVTSPTWRPRGPCRRRRLDSH